MGIAKSEKVLKSYPILEWEHSLWKIENTYNKYEYVNIISGINHFHFIKYLFNLF